jgi:glucose/arabinose dehydrogenase
MRRQLFNRLFIGLVAAAASVAACGGDSGDTSDSDGGSQEDSGVIVLPDGSVISTKDASVADAKGGTTDGSTVHLDGSSSTDGATLADGSGAEASVDASFDAGEDASFDAGQDANDGAVQDGPDLSPAPFPTTTPLIFGYTLVDAFPAAGALFAAMDIDWPKGSPDPYYLHRQGYILRLPAGGARQIVLDFSNLVYANDEAGALGMALHPKFADAVAPKPYVYLWYNFTNNGGATTRQHLSRFTYNTGTKVFDPGSELVLVDQAEGTHFHNGAHLRFGPDGYLYFGNGDDQLTASTAQTLTGGLFSGVFRIDVDQIGGAVSHAPPKKPLNANTQGYFIPNDNPFVGVANANEEYYALGFRNPYGFNFDKANGNLWLGDVGDTWREEVDQVFPGGNYGWPFFEGDKRRQAGNPAIGVTYAPVFAYTHASIGDLTATMAGYVYRGAALPELAGKFIFSDWPTGRVWALDTATGVRTSLMETNWQNAPLGWGQDAAGELYMVTWSKILKLTRAPAPHTVPTKLSDTNFFRNLQTLKTSSYLKPYLIMSPLWSDAAAKQRWVYMPAGKTATMTASGVVTLPAGAMLIKQFDLPVVAQPQGGRTKRLETRVMVVGTDTTYGVSYRWRADGSDADLMYDAIDEHIDDAVPAEARDWHFPSQGECWSCHRSENRILGFKGEQMNFNLPDGTNQLTWLASQGVFDNASIASSPAPLVSPADGAAPILARANAYLAANCSSCHHPGASYLGSGQTWNAMPGVATNARGLVNAPNNNAPMAGAFGLPGGVLIAPGSPANSLLYQRISSADHDLLMPPIGRTRVDPVGQAVINAWITAGPP